MSDFLKAVTDTPYTPPVPKPRVPLEWEPRIDTAAGEAVIALDTPPDSAIDWSGYLREWGFDPDIYTIKDDELEVRTWDSGDRRLWYYRAKVVKRLFPDADLTETLARIRRHRPLKREPAGGVLWPVVALTDWQIGKRDGGGTDAVVDRVLELADSFPDYVASLPAGVGGVVIAGLGDLVEGCTGSYPAQEFRIDFDRRDQVKIARRLILKLVQEWSKLAPELVLTAVPGNHGSNYRNGREFTNPGDNDDVAVVEQVGEILAANPARYGHVRVVVPRDDTNVVMDVAGQRLGLAHGHLMGGRSAGDQAWRWWKDQAHGDQPVGDADVLVTGHFHHLRVMQQGRRLWLQAPSLDASDWFVDRYGYRSEPGVLVFTLSPDGWDHLRIL